MKLKKWILGLFFLMCTFAMSFTVSADNKVSGFWEYTVSVGEATITKYNGSSKDIVIPTSVDGYPVTAIGGFCFSESNMETLVIPEQIEKIGDRAFADCKYLKKIYFNAKKCRLSDYYTTFRNAGKFSGTLDVVFGSSVQYVPGHLFRSEDNSNYAHVTSVTIPGNCKEIQSCAFLGCLDLKNIMISEGVLTIGASAFKECLSLKSITIPKSVERIGNWAFKDCKYLQQINFNAISCTLETIDNTFGNIGKFSSSLNIIFSDSVKSIPSHIFENTYVTTVKISKNVREIGGYAFGNSEALKTVTIQSRYLKLVDNNTFEETPKTVVFKCYQNSTAAAYAKKNGFKVSYLDAAVTKPSTPKLSSLTNSKGKKMVIKWSKVSNATGYQMQYSTSRTFSSGNKTKTITKNSTTALTVTKLTKNKTYYVRIRAYKKASGKTYYSSWSSAKKVTIKK